MNTDNIDYVEIAEFFGDIINDIYSRQNKITGWKWREEPEPTSEEIENAKKDYDACHWSFDRASSRAAYVISLIEFKDEADFPSFALSNLRNTKQRINGFLEDALLTYPDYELDKYDNILVDYYDGMDKYPGAVSKYTYLEYLRSNVEMLCYTIDSHYDLLNEECFDSIREDNSRLLDEIVVRVKELYGFKEPVVKKNSFRNYERWQKR